MRPRPDQPVETGWGVPVTQFDQAGYHADKYSPLGAKPWAVASSAAATHKGAAGAGWADVVELVDTQDLKS